MRETENPSSYVKKFINDPSWMITVKNLKNSQILLQQNAIDALREGRVHEAQNYQRQSDALRFCDGPYCPLPEKKPPPPCTDRYLPVRIVEVKTDEKIDSESELEEDR